MNISKMVFPLSCDKINNRVKTMGEGIMRSPILKKKERTREKNKAKNK